MTTELVVTYTSACSANEGLNKLPQDGGTLSAAEFIIIQFLRLFEQHLFHSSTEPRSGLLQVAAR